MNRKFNETKNLTDIHSNSKESKKLHPNNRRNKPWKHIQNIWRAYHTY
jgi:hypothetical protein